MNKLAPKVISELQGLQKTLELKEEDIIPIEERSTTPIRESRQKSLRYRQEVQHLADKDGGEISTLSRSILNALQVSLGLSPSEVNLIEEEILKPFSTKKENLKQYEQVFSEAIKQGYPIPDSVRESLKRLQKILNLTDDGTMSVEEIVTSQISSTSTQDDDLSSDLKIDYAQLRDLLKSAKWKEADTETYLIILRAFNREAGDWIRNEELKKFPCKELRTIDRLWKKYSNDRFGFSIQKEIYEKIEGKPGTYNHLVFQKFGDHVGWRVNGEWLLYEKLTFNLTAPEGHLPGWFGGLNFPTLFFAH